MRHAPCCHSGPGALLRGSSLWKYKLPKGVMKVVYSAESGARGTCQKPLLAFEHLSTCKRTKSLLNWRRDVFFSAYSFVERIEVDTDPYRAVFCWHWNHTWRIRKSSLLNPWDDSKSPYVITFPNRGMGTRHGFVNENGMAPGFNLMEYGCCITLKSWHTFGWDSFMAILSMPSTVATRFSLTLAGLLNKCVCRSSSKWVFSWVDSSPLLTVSAYGPACTPSHIFSDYCDGKPTERRLSLLDGKVGVILTARTTTTKTNMLQRKFVGKKSSYSVFSVVKFAPTGEKNCPDVHWVDNVFLKGQIHGYDRVDNHWWE